MSYAAAARAIREADTITITTHLNPDGDGIGTGLALLFALEAMGKRVRFLCPSVPASLYGFLPGFRRIVPVLTEAAARRQKPVDLVISCDCGDLKRLGATAHLRRTRLLNLDHHATNDRFGDLNLVDVAGESSGVVAEAVLRRLKVPLDRRLAECLYTTIVFDTGRFMHSNTTARCLRWTARLMDTGIDASAINRKLTYTRTPNDLELQRLGIGRLEVDRSEPRVAGIALSRADIAAVGEPEDWGDLVEIPRSLRGNEIAYLMREHKDGKSVRVSLRSNPPYAIAPVAQAFGGGGHAQAAGCTVPGSLKEVRKEIVARLRRQL